MSLKTSATKGASQFAVPLSEVVTLRDDLDRRATALRASMSSQVYTGRSEGALNALTSVRKELSGMISATRAAGKRTDSPADAVLNRAAARLVQRMAEDLDDNAERLMDEWDVGTDPTARQRTMQQAQTSEAEATRLWYVLTVFMEHTGLGPEDLDAPSERQPRQASDLTHGPG